MAKQTTRPWWRLTGAEAAWLCASLLVGTWLAVLGSLHDWPSAERGSRAGQVPPSLAEALHPALCNAYRDWSRSVGQAVESMESVCR